MINLLVQIPTNQHLPCWYLVSQDAGYQLRLELVVSLCVQIRSIHIHENQGTHTRRSQVRDSHLRPLPGYKRNERFPKLAHNECRKRPLRQASLYAPETN